VARWRTGASGPSRSGTRHSTVLDDRQQRRPSPRFLPCRRRSHEGMASASLARRTRAAVRSPRYEARCDRSFVHPLARQTAWQHRGADMARSESNLGGRTTSFRDNARRRCTTSELSSVRQRGQRARSNPAVRIGGVGAAPREDRGKAGAVVIGTLASVNRSGISAIRSRSPIGLGRPSRGSRRGSLRATDPRR
jgi:hypothetical protein